MDCYNDFAYLYDKFMEDVPYEKWAELLTSLLKAYGDDVKDVIDLGCGTGTLTCLLNDRGFSMMGVDYSADMLSVAMDKSFEAGKDIMYINQDMRELELLEKADAVICVCDSINYLLLDEDILNTFKRVYDNLKTGGLFILDFNTVYKYETVIGDTTIAENRDDCSFIWDNFYSPEDHINEYDVTFFTHVEGENEDIFRRFSETHIQRGYTYEEMHRMAKAAGFNIVTALDEDGLTSVKEDSERIYLILRK